MMKNLNGVDMRTSVEMRSADDRAPIWTMSVSPRVDPNVLKQKGAWFRDNYLDNLYQRHIDMSSVEKTSASCQGARVETMKTSHLLTGYVTLYLHALRQACQICSTRVMLAGSPLMFLQRK